jgi:exonuclease SbcD
MKFIHLSDLHLGKSVYEFSLIEDQEYILCKVLTITDSEKPDCVLIAGDVFDRSIASTDALRLFDEFLVGLAKRKIQVFVINGNHDSADRLSFGSRLIDTTGIHISPVYDNNVTKHTISDEYGDIDIYLLPFLKPILVKRFFPEEEIETWTEALGTVIKNISINSKNRNVILAHQFVTGSDRCDSEETNIGGADNVDASVFDAFDYVALGHLHGPQSVGRKTVRYCGSPLKYSFSESLQKKSVTIVEMAEKGNMTIRETPLIPKRDMHEIRGKYLEVTAKDYYKDLNRDDFYHITLTDEDDQSDAFGKLRIIYPSLMHLDYDNKRTKGESDSSGSIDASMFTPLEIFEKFYKDQNNQDITDIQRDYLQRAIEKVWGNEE